MRKFVLVLLVGILLVGLASATSSYYDPTSDVATGWDDGPVSGSYTEIDERGPD